MVWRFVLPKRSTKRFGLNPREACIDTWKRIEALQSLKAIIEGHARSLKPWIDGAPGVVFPLF